MKTHKGSRTSVTLQGKQNNNVARVVSWDAPPLQSICKKARYLEFMGVRRGGKAPWLLKISAKNIVFLVSGGKKLSSPLLAPPRKFWKQTQLVPLGKNSYDAHARALSLSKIWEVLHLRLFSSSLTEEISMKYAFCRRLQQWRGRRSTKLETVYVCVCVNHSYLETQVYHRVEVVGDWRPIARLFVAIFAFIAKCKITRFWTPPSTTVWCFSIFWSPIQCDRIIYRQSSAGRGGSSERSCQAALRRFNQ